MGKKPDNSIGACDNDAREAMQAEAYTPPFPCRDCNKPVPTTGKPRSQAAIESGRCQKCQDERDEYYAERMRLEHGKPRRKRGDWGNFKPFRSNDGEV